MPRSPSHATPLRIVALLVAVAATAGACGSDDGAGGNGETEGDRPTVIATTSILGDVTADVVGDLATVEVLLPPGTDPHDFEPSARQVADLQEADLIVANGLGLEAGLADALAGASDRGVPVLELAPQLGPIPFADHGGDDHADDEHADDEHADDERAEDEHAEDGGGGDDDHSDEGSGADDVHGDLDPHVWTDPDRMATAAGLIAEAVAEATAVDRATLDANARRFDDELRALDEDIQATLAAIPAERRVLVTNHESLGYFAERYGFEVVGTVIPGGSTLAEPSAAGIASLADTVRAAGVPAIFAENVVATDLADALAAEVGGDVEVVALFTDSLGGPGSGAETYVEMMGTNAERIAGALAP